MTGYRFWRAVVATGLGLAAVATGQTRVWAGAEPPAAERVFKETPQGPLKLLFHFPADWKAGEKRPGIVFFFGGGWRTGTPAQFLPQAEYLAKRGMVTVRAEYRIADKHHTTPEKAVEDARSAVRWLRGHAAELGIDPHRLVASGGSAGAHLAACTALLGGPDDAGEDKSVSCRPDALVLFNPVMDFAGIKIADAQGKDLGAELSPLGHLRKGLVPTVQFFGSADRLLEGAREFHRKALSQGDRSELYTAADQPHGFFNRPPWREVTLRRADLFLASLGYVKGEPNVEVPAGAPSLRRVE